MLERRAAGPHASDDAPRPGSHAARRGSLRRQDASRSAPLQKEELDDALHALDEYFQSDEWQQRVRQLKSLDLDSVQTRMKALEQRLQELERQLAEKRR